MKPRVIIEVRGGVAEVAENRDDVEVIIVDWDNWTYDYADTESCLLCGGHISDFGRCEDCNADYNGEPTDAVDLVNSREE